VKSERFTSQEAVLRATIPKKAREQTLEKAWRGWDRGRKGD